MRLVVTVPRTLRRVTAERGEEGDFSFTELIRALLPNSYARMVIISTNKQY
jgi:hypothetical protein